jgi:hypothetical protein
VASGAPPPPAAHDPTHALQQLDLLYLDEAAPGAAQVGFRPGTPAVVVFCAGDCRLPTLAGAQVLRSGDPELARRYALGQGGRTGIALLDADGRVRYRSYDPAPDRHENELQILVDGVRGSG